MCLGNKEKLNINTVFKNYRIVKYDITIYLSLIKYTSLLRKRTPYRGGATVLEKTWSSQNCK